MVEDGDFSHKIDYVTISLRASKSHYWFKSYGDFADWVDFAHWWSFLCGFFFWIILFFLVYFKVTKVTT